MNPQGNERLKGLELLSVVLAQSSGTLLAKLKLVKERNTKAKEEGYEENAAFPIFPSLFHLLPKALNRFTLTFSDQANTTGLGPPAPPLMVIFRHFFTPLFSFAIESYLWGDFLRSRPNKKNDGKYKYHSNKSFDL